MNIIDTSDTYTIFLLVSLHKITLHCMTLLYMTLHYIALHYISLFSSKILNFLFSFRKPTRTILHKIYSQVPVVYAYSSFEIRRIIKIYLTRP